jgi:hypothetical protein
MRCGAVAYFGCLLEWRVAAKGVQCVVASVAQQHQIVVVAPTALAAGDIVLVVPFHHRLWHSWLRRLLLLRRRARDGRCLGFLSDVRGPLGRRLLRRAPAGRVRWKQRHGSWLWGLSAACTLHDREDTISRVPVCEDAAIDAAYHPANLRLERGALAQFGLRRLLLRCLCHRGVGRSDIIGGDVGCWFLGLSAKEGFRRLCLCRRRDLGRLGLARRLWLGDETP